MQADGTQILNADVLMRLLTRLRYLNTVLPADVQVMVNISRCPHHQWDMPCIDRAIALVSHVARVPACVLQAAVAKAATIPPSRAGHCVDDASSAAGSSSESPADPTMSVSLAALVRGMLVGLASAEQWTLQCTHEVFMSDHLNMDGSLNAETVMRTLARMFLRDMVFACSSSEFLVAQHIFTCFKRPHLRLDADRTFSLWVDREVFHEYLEHEAKITEVPDTIMLQLFDRVALVMARTGLCLAHCQRNLTRMSLHITVLSDESRSAGAPLMRTFLFQNVPLVSSACKHGGPDGGPVPVEGGHGSEPLSAASYSSDASVAGEPPVEIRFPYHVALLDIVESYFARNVPGELWLGKGTRLFAEGADAALRTRLATVVETMADALVQPAITTGEGVAYVGSTPCPCPSVSRRRGGGGVVVHKCMQMLKNIYHVSRLDR